MTVVPLIDSKDWQDTNTRDIVGIEIMRFSEY